MLLALSLETESIQIAQVDIMKESEHCLILTRLFDHFLCWFSMKICNLEWQRASIRDLMILVGIEIVNPLRMGDPLPLQLQMCVVVRSR